MVICHSIGKADASKERRYPIFVTLSLWVECSLKRLTFNPRSKATNIGYLLSLEAVFGWGGIANSFPEFYLWKSWVKIKIKTGGFEDSAAGWFKRFFYC